MGDCIMYTQPNGNVAVVIGVVWAAVPKEATDAIESTLADLPQDRTYRNAWIKNGTGARVSMVKARAIHMGRIRTKRDAELKELDTAWIIAKSKNLEEEAAAVATLKQKLREIPQTFDLTVAKTPEELAALWPAELRD